MRHDNENQPLELQPIAIALAKLVKRLDPNKQQGSERENDTQRGNADKKNSRDHREYVDQRLRELAAFERRASGNKKTAT